MDDETQIGSTSDPTITDVESLILRNVEEFASPPSAFELSTLAEVLVLPRVNVTRPPESQLLGIGMRRNDCHANCAMQAINDTEGKSRHVTGWYVTPSCLVLHSVVEIEGQWFCLTPQIVRGPEQFEFIPDEAIDWRDADDGMSRDPYRRGEKLPETLRRYPDLDVEMSREFRALVSSGMPIVDARDRVDAVYARRLAKLSSA